VVEPDILYVSKARASVTTEKNIQGAPDLVVEILSESTAKIDRTTKLKLYARYGVAEYWVVDPATCSAEIYRPFPVVMSSQPNWIPASRLLLPLPGFSLPLYKLAE